MKEWFKDVFNTTADKLGVYDMLLANKVYGRRGWFILMYHRVVPDESMDPFRLGMCVQLGRFRDQMAFIREHFNVISMGEAMDRIASGKQLPPNALSITFDDSYLDFRDHALPALREVGFPATVFAVTGNEGCDFWWDRVIAAFAGTRQPAMSLGILSGTRGSRELSLSSRFRRRKALLQTLAWLWQQPPDMLPALVERLESELGQGSESFPALPARRMTLDMIADLDPNEADVQAHTVTHPRLTLLPPQQALLEMRDSRIALEEACNRQITGFGYPAGYQDTRCQQLAREAGFEYAVGTQRGINLTPMNIFNLQRIGMPDSSVADIKRCFGSIALRQAVPVQNRASVS